MKENIKVINSNALNFKIPRSLSSNSADISMLKKKKIKTASVSICI